MKSLPPEALYKPIPLFLVLTFQIIYEYHRSELSPRIIHYAYPFLAEMFAPFMLLS